MVTEIIYLLMEKKIHLKEAIKKVLISFFVHYGDCEDKKLLKDATTRLEIELRAKANYYIKREEYDATDVIDVLQEIKDEKFLEEGLEGVDFKNKEFLTTQLHTMFKNLLNYMTILKNWSR